MTTADIPADVPTAAELLIPGTLILLTTVGEDGPLSRPVLLQADAEGRPDHVSVFTHEGTQKLADLEHDPRVTIAAPLPAPKRGWFSLPGTAVVTHAADDTARIDITLAEGRLWTIHSDAPFDNTISVLKV